MKLQIAYTTSFIKDVTWAPHLTQIEQRNSFTFDVLCQTSQSS